MRESRERLPPEARPGCEPARECSACAERVRSVYGACCELGRAGSVCKVGEFAI